MLLTALLVCLVAADQQATMFLPNGTNFTMMSNDKPLTNFTNDD